METRTEFERASAPALSSEPPATSWPAVWTEIPILGALLIVAFWPILVSMYGNWFDEHAYMEHGVLVIPAAVYMAWVKKDQLKTIPRQPSAWGLFLLLWGALQAVL